MARYGIATDRALGVTVTELRRIARTTGRDHVLAERLWQTGIHEARILATMVDVPAEVTEAQMEAWALDVDSWDLGDQMCANLFESNPVRLHQGGGVELARGGVRQAGRVRDDGLCGGAPA